jgi:hypothetical protein
MLNQFVINTTVTILDIISHPVFYLKTWCFRDKDWLYPLGPLSRFQLKMETESSLENVF